MNNIILDSKPLLAEIKKIAIQLNDEIERMNDMPIVVCVLDGAFRLYSDLVGCIHHKILCDFVKVTSYEGSKQGEMIMHKYPKYPVSGKHIIIVDDILDSGNTINYLIKQFNAQHAKSLTVVTLLHRKNSPILKDVKHIKGFEIGDEWVAGYGMDDLIGTSRHLNYIYEVEKKND